MTYSIALRVLKGIRDFLIDKENLEELYERLSRPEDTADDRILLQNGAFAVMKMLAIIVDKCYSQVLLKKGLGLPATKVENDKQLWEGM